MIYLPLGIAAFTVYMLLILAVGRLLRHRSRQLDRIWFWGDDR